MHDGVRTLCPDLFGSSDALGGRIFRPEHRAEEPGDDVRSLAVQERDGEQGPDEEAE